MVHHTITNIKGKIYKRKKLAKEHSTTCCELRNEHEIQPVLSVKTHIKVNLFFFKQIGKLKCFFFSLEKKALT